MGNKNNLLQRILNTFFLILILRIGTFIPIPHVDERYINQALNSNLLFQLCNNSDEPRVGILSLGLIPYVNASILIQFLTSLIPKLEQLQSEGEQGRKKITQLSRIVTGVLALIQSIKIAQEVKPTIFNWNLQINLEIILSLTIGALICLWLSEKITEKGIGNGTSMVIALNIIASLPWKNNIHINFSTGEIVEKGGIFILLVIGIVFIQEAIRQLPIVSAKQLFTQQESSETYLPLRINQGGVMPIIFASAFLNIIAGLNSIISETFSISLIGILPNKTWIIPILFSVLRFFLILISTFFYSLLILNPKEVAKELNKMAVTIPKIRPGKQTEYFLEQTIKRLATLGAFFLATLLTLPNLTTSVVSATSFLIIIGVIIEIDRKILTLLFTTTYKTNTN